MPAIGDQLNEAFAYLHGLWRYRWSAMMVVWLIAALGWLMVYAMPNQYEAKAVVHMDTTSIMQPLLEGLSVETDQGEEIALVTRLLLNRSNLLSILRETDMDLEVDSDVQKERLMLKLAKSINIKDAGIGRGRSGSSIYEISYTSSSDKLAYKVVSLLLNKLIENTLSADREDTVMAGQFLDKQIEEYEKRLAQAEARMAEFKKKNVGFMPDETGDYFARIRKAQEDIDTTRSALGRARQRYNDLHKQVSGELPILNGSNEKLRLYKEQLVDLLTQYTEEHPDVQAIYAKIADLEAGGAGGAVDQLGDGPEYNPVYQELKVQESEARIEVGQLQIELSEKQKKLAQLQKSMDIIPQVEADLAKLNRDYDITRERYGSLVERRESARLAQSVGQNNSVISFRIIDAPVVPSLPSGPNRPLLLAVVMVLALGAGFGWCLLRFLLHPTFVDYKQLRKAISLPVLGTIGLQMDSVQRRTRRVHLAMFVFALMLYIGAFVGVSLYQEEGGTQLRAVIAGASHIL